MEGCRSDTRSCVPRLNDRIAGGSNGNRNRSFVPPIVDPVYSTRTPHSLYQRNDQRNNAAPLVAIRRLPTAPFTVRPFRALLPTVRLFPSYRTSSPLR